MGLQMISRHIENSAANDRKSMDPLSPESCSGRVQSNEMVGWQSVHIDNNYGNRRQQSTTMLLRNMLVDH